MISQDVMNRAEFFANMAETYREMLSDYGREMTAERRGEFRRRMVFNQDKCAELVTRAQAVSA